MQAFPISQAGHTHLLQKLGTLRKEFEKMPAIIEHARSRGDLKENAEYHAAREKQGLLNAQLGKIQSDINQARIINPASLPPGIVTFGKKVTLTYLSDHLTQTYHLVGPAETDFFTNSLSVASDLAKGILAKKAGDVVSIHVPAGKRQYRIDKIEYP